jgi:hypothetical protein
VLTDDVNHIQSHYYCRDDDTESFYELLRQFRYFLQVFIILHSELSRWAFLSFADSVTTNEQTVSSVQLLEQKIDCTSSSVHCCSFVRASGVIVHELLARPES